MPQPEAPEPQHGPSAPSRRTVLAGAAWSVPAIALMTSTPAVAATSTLTLTFDRTAYTGDPCSTIDGATVTATTSGTATAGVAITVSLTNNYTFDGGATTSTGTSDGNGQVALPKIHVPSGAGNATATATAANATPQSASLSATTNYGRYLVGDTTSITSITSYNVTSSVTPIACYGMFYDQNAGTLTYAGTVIATGVTGAFGNRNGSKDYFSYVQNGVAKSSVGVNGTVQSTVTWDQVPAGATPVTYGAFFNSANGDLWYWNSLMKTNVNRVAGRSGAPTADDPNKWIDSISFFDAQGGWIYSSVAGSTPSTQGPANSVPASAIPTDYPLLLQNGNTQWRRNRAIAGIPASAGSQNGVLNAAGTGTQTTIYLSGVLNGTPRTERRFNEGGGATYTTFPGIPSSAKPVGPKGVFVDQGNLWYIDKIVDINVSSAVGDSLPDGSPRITVVKSC